MTGAKRERRGLEGLNHSDALSENFALKFCLDH